MCLLVGYRGSRMSLLRVGVVTPYFPLPTAPERGHSAYQTLSRIASFAEVSVFCPIATYPRWLEPSSYIVIRSSEKFPSTTLNAHYYPYPALPMVSRPFNSYICRRQFEPDLRAFRPDVVLSYWLHPAGHAATVAAHRMGVPSIVCSIGSDLRAIPDAFGRHLVRSTLSQADFVLTVSSELRQHALHLGATVERSAAILNGCDVSVFHPASQEEARRRLGVPLGCPVVVFVGNIIASKGLNELVDALKALLPKYPDLRIYCVGDGPMRPQLERNIVALGLSERLLLAGTVSSSGVAEWLAASNVFCLPSHSEGCPNVVIEAIACGRPVVATDVGGVSELMSPQCGVLVQPKNSASLAAGLDDALTREWDPESISGALSRSWNDVARETFEICVRVAAEGIVKRS